MIQAEEIEKRIVELDQMIQRGINEKNQLLGYKQCLADGSSDSESTKVNKGSKPKGE
tara:strand:+ start:403 stop:573 length:171 start_codon:yes stop_codon:yes gene_type:complete